MRYGGQRNGIDWVDPQCFQLGCPPFKLVEWIVVQAQILGGWNACDDFAEHPAEGFTIDSATMDSEADDSSEILVHDDHDRECFEQH